MKKVLATAALLVLAGPAVFAEWAAGSGALQLETLFSGTYDSNIRDSVDDIADYYFTFEPTLRYRSTDSRFTTNASAGVRFKRYADHSSANSDDANLRFDWRLLREADHTVGADLSLAYYEVTEPVLEVNTLVRTRTFSAQGSGEVLVARSNLLGAGFTYSDSQRNLGSDQELSSARVNYSYIGMPDGTRLTLDYQRQHNRSRPTDAAMPQLDQNADNVSASVSHPLFEECNLVGTYGYRWLDRGREEAAAGLPDEHGSFYSVGVDGPFLPRQYFPKTTGTFRLAYEQAAVPGLNEHSDQRLVGRLDVAWQARPRTKVRVFASRSQELTIDDNTVIDETGGVGLTQLVGEFVTLEATVRRTNADFINLARTDNRSEGELSGTWQVNRRWSSQLGYRYLHSESNAALANFDRHLVRWDLTYVF